MISLISCADVNGIAHWNICVCYICRYLAMFAAVFVTDDMFHTSHNLT